MYEGNTKLSELLCTLSYLKIVSGFDFIDFFFIVFLFWLSFQLSTLRRSQRLVLKLHIQICFPKYKRSSPNILTQFFSVIQVPKKQVGVINLFDTVYFMLLAAPLWRKYFTSFREITLEKLHDYSIECLKRQLAFLVFKHDTSFD